MYYRCCIDINIDTIKTANMRYNLNSTKLTCVFESKNYYTYMLVRYTSERARIKGRVFFGRNLINPEIKRR